MIDVQIVVVVLFPACTPESYRRTQEVLRAPFEQWRCDAPNDRSLTPSTMAAGVDETRHVATVACECTNWKCPGP